MLENLEPKKVFQYFEEICQIPHSSYHVEAISDYLMNFADKHGLEAYQDEFYNVIMIKEASAGKEDVEPVMIQGHMDMVAVKDDDTDIDLLKDPLRLAMDGDYIYAEKTSLGGDDGIAIAYGLALMADDSLSLPRIELVITTEEEVGMEGATGIDLSVCQANRMLNLDSEEEGEFVVACAGGVRVNAYLPVERKAVCDRDDKIVYEIQLSGFTGGHSGTEIICHRANANKVLGNALQELRKAVSFGLVSVCGGTKDNAIPVSAKATIVVSKKDCMVLENVWQNISDTLLELYQETDPDGKMSLECMTKQPPECIADERAKEIIDFLCAAPDGVQKMCRDLEGLVETSLNLGIVESDEKGMRFVFSIRSSVAIEKDRLCKTVCDLITEHHGTYKLVGNYPAWEYKEDSKLRDHMMKVYAKQYQKPAKVLSIHAGLECGILAAKKPGLDCVSFGPDILDIHTTREKLSISSVQRVWKFLLEVLETL